MRPNSVGVTGEQISLVCPHCQAELAVRVEVKADVAPPLRLRFEDAAEFDEWLRASGMTLDEFETLPVFEWYREELEPFARASRESRNAAKPRAALSPA